MDSKDLEKGEDIVKLLGIIKVSDLSIAIFSEKYVESKWCLKELTQMLECHRTNGQVIFPVFYKVTASDVKKQTGCFEMKSQKHGKEEALETLQKWKDTLRAVGNMSGWEFQQGADESELVHQVVQKVWSRLNRVPLTDVKHLVGIESRVNDVLSLLSNTSSEDVQFLGICGPGGIGKTTISKAVYNRLFRNFSKYCFLENVRERASQPNGIVSLEKVFLEKICGQEVKVCGPSEGSGLIKRTLGKIDSLLILDDVGTRDQLNALAGDLNWFGPQSRVIVTTRDWTVLSGVPKNNRKIYKPTELNEEEGVRLFSLYAFSKDQPPDDFKQPSVDIVRTTGGLPLALQVLGSDLSTKEDKKAWEDMHRIVKEVPHSDVYGKLKISYDNLQDETVKAMFLDAACFFIGWEEKTVILIWEACDFESRYYMDILMEKSLLTIGKDDFGHRVLWMHDQIRDMGRRIAYNGSKDPNNHSRLWSHHNIKTVLKNHKGNKMVEGFFYRFNPFDGTSIDFDFDTKDLERMPELRLLQIDTATLKGSFQCLPPKLRWLRWRHCRLKNISVDFYHEDLVILDLSRGGFGQAWNKWPENKLLFQQLKVLQLQGSLYLTESPDFSGFPSLERLDLSSCEALVNLHESIGQCQQLVYLNLKNCRSLEKLPNTICRLRSLRNLKLNDCFSLKELPKSIGDLNESLVELSLANTNIKVLPNGVGLLEKLEVLNLSGYVQQEHLLRSIMEKMTTLRCLDLDGNQLKSIRKLPSTLTKFRVSGKHFESLPDMRDLKNLVKLVLIVYRVKTERFRGFVKTRNNDEFSEVMMDRQCCVVTNNHRWMQTQGQQVPIVMWGHIESWRQIWIPLQQQKICEDVRIEKQDQKLRCKYQIPDDDICSSGRLIMLVSCDIPKAGQSILWDGHLHFRIESIVHGKDRKTSCDVMLIIENSLMRGQNHIEYIHEFEGFDWFGLQLEGKDAIEIVTVHNYLDMVFLTCHVSEVNLFLIKEGQPMFDNHQFNQRFLEIVRYNFHDEIDSTLLSPDQQEDEGSEDESDQQEDEGWEDKWDPFSLDQQENEGFEYDGDQQEDEGSEDERFQTRKKKIEGLMKWVREK